MQVPYWTFLKDSGRLYLKPLISKHCVGKFLSLYKKIEFLRIKNQSLKSLSK